MHTAPRVVIVGAGFAGLETAFTLHAHLGDRARLLLIADQRDFVFKPNSIYLPFGGDEEKLHVPLTDAAVRRGIDLIRGSLARVDTEANRIKLTDGTLEHYDHLVLATGAAMRPEEVPGLAEYARTIWTPEQMRELGDELERLQGDVEARQTKHVLFLMPPGNKCAGPLYEIAFMAETWLRRHHLRDRVCLTFTTFEAHFIQAFGPGIHKLVAEEFHDRGINGYTHHAVTRVDGGEVHYANGTSRTYDLLVAFPPYTAAVDYPTLPTDDRGFLLTEPDTRRVRGTDNVYAPGDSGDFPVKQAFLAFLQADAVADDIAARIDPAAVKHPRRFEPVSMCVMEMLDKAAFAQVPLETTGDAAAPVRVDADADDDYLVGVSPLWRLGKKALGVYLPQQFHAGRPFHGGLPWHAMELGLKGMSKALASAVKE
ncbi:NAD(P)/FAD-dependent oxidoreductase [Glycomyces albidus]|uniref:NAD(P)/FAD-dependent oxidoreductase n=1 Tax=Glycomyces albidus TaxID=2656774 RepID=A0A6L5G9E4_9ACTN|nr:FAD-dependent oxidoreductase [Glycomyces albidus]MQM26188.1 NAD(P)/FAD-dependent oxidoreductase [Glycomyces albidus]